MTDTEFEDIIAGAKSRVERNPDETGVHVLMRKDNDIIIAVLSFTRELKREAIEKLKELIKQEGVTRYFISFTAWQVSHETAQSEIKKRIHAAKNSNLTQDQIQNALKEIFEIANQPPSTNPARKEILCISRHDKSEGSRIVTFPMERTDDGITWGEPLDTGEFGTLTTFWNIWTQHQVNLGESGENNG